MSAVTLWMFIFAGPLDQLKLKPMDRRMSQRMGSRILRKCEKGMKCSKIQPTIGIGSASGKF